MPARIDADTLAKLRHYAEGGDPISGVIAAILAGTFSAQVAVGAEGATGANVIRLTGQIKNQDGSPRAGVQQVLARSIPIAGAGTMTIGAAVGTAKKGSGTTELWLETDANGKFDIDVLNASVEDNLIRLETDNGETEVIKLTFA